MSEAAQILKTAGDLFMTLGIRSVSMDDISSKLGISKKTLYQFIDNKQDLVDQTIQKHIAEEENLLQHLRDQSSDAIHEFVQLAEYLMISLRGMTPTVTHDLQKYYPKAWKKVEEFHQGTISNFIKDNLTKGKDQGLYRSDLDINFVTAIYLTQTMAITQANFIEAKYFDAERIILQHTRYHLFGILSELGRKHLKAFKFFDQ